MTADVQRRVNPAGLAHPVIARLLGATDSSPHFIFSPSFNTPRPQRAKWASGRDTMTPGLGRSKRAG